MMTEYFSLRYIYVSDTVDNKVSRGVFLYCYKMEMFKNNKQYMDFLDTYIERSIQKQYPKAQIQHQEIINDHYWLKWLTTLHKQSIPFYNIPACEFSYKSMGEIDAQRDTLYPCTIISFYPEISVIPEDPSFPFNKIDFRYPIELTDEFSLFATDLSIFIRNNLFTFEEACPKMRFNNLQHLAIFNLFYKSFSNRISYKWPELMHIIIDVYNENNLKWFMTDSKALLSKSDINDTPYMSICFLRIENGFSNDIIENSELCKGLKLTIGERFALIAHEIGHFVDTKNWQERENNDEEIACDCYAVELGLGSALKSALQKIVDAKICTVVNNEKIIERINRLNL